jgi:hypothetical protein
VTKKILGLMLMLAALSVSAQTNPAPWCCRQPYRSLRWRRGGDESPLPGVAPAPAGSPNPRRPLAAWKRITGVKTGEQYGCWVVDADIATSPTTHTNEWILLQNPPAAEAEQYYNLKALLVQYDTQMAGDRESYRTETNAEARAAGYARADAQADTKMLRVNTYEYRQLAAKKAAAAATTLADWQQIEQARERARKQLAAIPSSDGQYQLDVFALELGRNRSGQLVFDAGVPLADGAP